MTTSSLDSRKEEEEAEEEDMEEEERKPSGNYLQVLVDQTEEATVFSMYLQIIGFLGFADS